ncbi:hypothetical protein B1R94_11120 [Mycolicibacterium litorale]|nr:hypothetical protein B1R94_11120 [Mycolicibacterium litorale]
MSGPHTDIGPELRALAQTILDRIDPAIRAGAAMAGAAGAPGKCQQVWCPVCALAALINGEQHPLLTVVADHSVALVTMIRAMVDESPAAPPGPDEPPPDGSGPAPGAGGPSRYEHIPITVED